MKVETERFMQVAREELNNARTRGLLKMISSIVDNLRNSAMASFPDPPAALEYGRAIRAESLGRLPELLEQFECAATANGAKIFWARSADEANQLVLNLAKERNIKYVTKGKSMVSEEMGLNDVLTQNDIEVFEADLGEFITQMLKRPPFHIVGPAINIPIDEISNLFLKKGLIEQPTRDPVELGAAARQYLREKFRNLEMGITGINMAVAETGTIINVENEGNIRFTKSSPKIQVSLMTIEKVVPTMRDATHLLRLLCRNCTAQKISAYVTMDSGPKKPDELDGPEELFIIVLDNGRSSIYQNENLRDALRCIRCGACMYACPVYMKIGGYPYGWAYSGPMGQVVNPLLLGLDKTQDLYRACSLCGKCKVICPGGIDHPKMFLHYRAMDVGRTEELKAQARPLVEQKSMSLFSWVIRRAWRWNAGLRGIRPLVNMHARENVISQMPLLKGWLRHRDLPAIAKRTFRERMKKRFTTRKDENE